MYDERTDTHRDAGPVGHRSRAGRIAPTTVAFSLTVTVTVAVVLLFAPVSASAQISPDLDLRPDTTVGDRPEGGEGGRDGDRSPPAGGGDGGSNTGVLVGGLVAGGVVGGLCGFLVARGRASGDQTRPAPTVPAPSPGPGGGDESARQAYEAQVAAHAGQAQQALAERGALVAALIDVVDTSTSDAVRVQVAERLATVSVVPFEAPVGSPFDPSLHRGVQSVAAPSASHHNVVARTDRSGWADRGAVVRQPEVVVYHWESE